MYIPILICYNVTKLSVNLCFREDLFMANSLMHADDGEKNRKITITSRQRNGLFVLIGIQAACILISYILFIITIATGKGVAAGLIFLIMLYVIIYLKYCQACQSLGEFGIRLKWMKVCKIVSPLLYIPAMVLGMLSLSA